MCVCWLVLLGLALGIRQRGRVGCVVVNVSVYVGWVGKRGSACVLSWHALRMPGMSICWSRM